MRNPVVVFQADVFGSGKFVLELFIQAALIFEILESLLIAKLELILRVFHQISILLS